MRFRRFACVIAASFLLGTGLGYAQSPATVRIATWNMERLGSDSAKDYATLAAVVQTFDLVGCIEVIQPRGLENVLNRLGPTWRALVSKTAVGRNGYNEYYAYLWNSAKVALVSDLGYFADTQDVFVREPYGATFSSGGWSFTLVLSHILYGTSEIGRRAEISHLAEVYTWFLAKGGVPDEILGGDFNEGRKAAFVNLMRMDGVTDAFGFSHLTTLGLHGPASDYDHIFLSQLTMPRMSASGELDFVVLFEGGDYALARSKLSDHLPVWVELHTQPSPQGD